MYPPLPSPDYSLDRGRGKMFEKHVLTKIPANFLNPSLNTSNTSWCSALEGKVMKIGVSFQRELNIRVCVCVCVCGSTYISDSVTWVTEERLLRVCSVSWVRWGTVPKCVYSKQPGTSRECCAVLPSPLSTPSRFPPWTTRDSSSFILAPAFRGAAVEIGHGNFGAAISNRPL